MAWGDINFPSVELCGFHDRIYMVGDMLPLSLTVVDRNNAGFNPSASPTYQIFDASGNEFVAVTKMPIHNRYVYGSTGNAHFQHSILVTTNFSTGTSMILYRYTVSGVTYLLAESISVINTVGDDDGSVLSMGRVSRPEGDYLLYRTKSGDEKAGLEPK